MRNIDFDFEKRKLTDEEKENYSKELKALSEEVVALIIDAYHAGVSSGWDVGAGRVSW